MCKLYLVMDCKKFVSEHDELIKAANQANDLIDLAMFRGEPKGYFLIEKQNGSSMKGLVTLEGVFWKHEQKKDEYKLQYICSKKCVCGIFSFDTLKDAKDYAVKIRGFSGDQFLITAMGTYIHGKVEDGIVKWSEDCESVKPQSFWVGTTSCSTITYTCFDSYEWFATFPTIEEARIDALERSRNLNKPYYISADGKIILEKITSERMSRD